MDGNGIKTGLKDVEKSTRKTFEELAEESGKTVEELRSDAKRIAEEYQKQGVNIPNSYKKAYADMGVYSKSVKQDMVDDAEDIGDSHEKSSEKARLSWRNALSGIGSLTKQGFSVLSSVAATAAKAATAAITGVGTALSGLATMGVQYNAGIEQYETSFEVMTGSAEKAAEVIDSLKKVGAETPFELDNLADVTQLLMNYGFEANSAMDKMMMLGDISQGSADKMQRIATAYGQMSSAGKVSLEDVKQMIEAGFNPLQEISESTGESMASLYERISDGALAVDEITSSMQRATSEGGKYYRSMEKQSQTITGMISTLKDNAQQLLGEIVEPLTESVGQKLLPTAIDAVEQLTTAFRENGTEGLIEAGSKIISDVLVGITDALPGIIGTASNIIQTIVDNLNENLPQLLTTGGQILTSLADGVISVLGSLWDLGSNIIEHLITGLMENMPAISEKAKEILLGFIQGFIDNFPSAVQTGTELLTSVIQGISSMLPELVPAAVDAIVTFADTLLQNLPTIIDAGIDLLFSLVEGIVKALPTLIQEAPRIINDFWDEFDANLWKIIKAGASLIVKLGKGIIDSIPLILENAGEIVKAIFNTIAHVDMLNLGKSLITKLGNGIKGMLSNIGKAARDVVSNLLKPFNITNWKDIGNAIIGGISAGIASAAHSLVDSAISAASNAINTVKGWLGIHSPSRRAKKEIGIPLITGAAEGAEDATPKFVKASEDSARSAIEAMQDVSASDFVRRMQGESYRKAADNEMSARNKYQNNGYDPEDPDSDGDVIVNNQFIVDGKPLVDETVKKTKREIAKEQRNNQAAKGEVVFG